MRALSLGTRLFLSCFLVSALLFAGIYFYVKGFNGQRETARAEQAFERALSRYQTALKARNQSLEAAAFSIAEDSQPLNRDLARAELLSTGLSFATLRASRVESDLPELSSEDAQLLRAEIQDQISLIQLSSGRYFAKRAAAGAHDSWKLVLLFPLAEFERASQELLEAFLVSGLALLLLTTIFSQLLSREITRPLTDLRDKLRLWAEDVGFEPPKQRGDEITEMTQAYFDVVKSLHTAYEHKRLALNELESYKGELLRVNQNLHRRLFQVKVLLSLWSERDQALDVKDFLSRFLEATLPGLPFEYGCVIIRPLAHLRSETIFAKKTTTAQAKEYQSEDTQEGTQKTDILDPKVKEFLLRESDACMGSLTVRVGDIEGRLSHRETLSRITVLSLRLKQGEEALGSVHFLTEQKDPVFAESMKEFLLNLSAQVAAQLQIQTLSYATRVDPLTRLYNQGYLHDKLREELVRSARGKYSFSLVLLDLDHFRRVNEEHGRQAADEALQGVAALLKKTCRGSDTVCRHEGSKLAILLAETPLAGARIFAENVRRAVSEEAFALKNGGKLRVTASLGIAEFPAHGSGVEELLAQAEKALAEAKAGGRNKVGEAA